MGASEAAHVGEDSVQSRLATSSLRSRRDIPAVSRKLPETNTAAILKPVIMQGTEFSCMEWKSINFMKKLIQIQTDIIFLSKCKQMDIIPKGLKNIIHNGTTSTGKTEEYLTAQWLGKSSNPFHQVLRATVVLGIRTENKNSYGECKKGDSEDTKDKT
ncbi:hypothetical protein UY3_10171 [Chelonia mydas]|uniref:Uncharacterized protein n=1 Tax=Chelonia mydas TaxID=8469 RepID=M7B438_CHEMY|nr:hypothetical protein UY3_10171 [Chelonia mydas]